MLNQIIAFSLKNRFVVLLAALALVVGGVYQLARMPVDVFPDLNRPTVTVDPLGHRSTSLYDSAGHLTGTQDRDGHLTQFLYDAAGRPTVVIDALNHRATQLYDGAGHLTGTQDRNGNLTQYLFDGLNRQTGAFVGLVAMMLIAYAFKNVGTRH